MKPVFVMTSSVIRLLLVHRPPFIGRRGVSFKTFMIEFTNLLDLFTAQLTGLIILSAFNMHYGKVHTTSVIFCILPTCSCSDTNHRQYCEALKMLRRRTTHPYIQHHAIPSSLKRHFLSPVLRLLVVPRYNLVGCGRRGFLVSALWNSSPEKHSPIGHSCGLSPRRVYLNWLRPTSTKGLSCKTVLRSCIL